MVLASAWTVSSERITLVDLSSVRCMLNGAEPVRATTLRSFATHFAACGLRLEALAPGYGMAETCILVSVSAVRPNRLRLEFELGLGGAVMGLAVMAT